MYKYPQSRYNISNRNYMLQWEYILCGIQWLQKVFAHHSIYLYYTYIKCHIIQQYFHTITKI